MVGLVPKESMIQAGKYYLKRMGESTGLPERMIIEAAVQSMGLRDLCEFDIEKKIIEYAIENKENLVNMTVCGLIDELSTDSPAPGGGSVAAICAAMSAALSAMVANLTINKKGYEKNWDVAKLIADRAQDVKNRAIYAVDKDTLAFYAMMNAMKLPKVTVEDQETRKNAIEKATKDAILIPLETIEIALDCVELAEEISSIGNKNALSDAGVAAITANAAAKAAYLNVKINMTSIEDLAFKDTILSKALTLANSINDKALQVESNINNTL